MCLPMAGPMKTIRDRNSRKSKSHGIGTHGINVFEISARWVVRDSGSTSAPPPWRWSPSKMGPVEDRHPASRSANSGQTSRHNPKRTNAHPEGHTGLLACVNVVRECSPCLSNRPMRCVSWLASACLGARHGTVDVGDSRRRSLSFRPKPH